MDEKINPEVRFEPKDISIRAVASVGVAIVIAAVVLHLVLYELYQMLDAGAAESGRVPAMQLKADAHTPPDGPQLQVNPVADMKEFRKRENEKLSSYGWVDKEKGVVRIPIEAAMQKVLENGLPKIDQAATQTASPVPKQND